MNNHETPQSNLDFDDMVFEPIPGDKDHRTDYPESADLGKERLFQIPTEVSDRIAELALKEVSTDA